VIPEGSTPALEHPFKGNMDLERLDAFLRDAPRRRARVFVTITNNSGGGQPVSLENLRGVRALCDRHGVPLFLDACRFAENAWFIREREAGQGDRDVADIVRDIAALADGMTMSAKKDGLANIGGWLALRDDALAARCRNLLILTEGFPTYGGLAGRDLDAIAQGSKEVVQHDYLRYRIRSTAYLGDGLQRAGIPSCARRRPRRLPRRPGAAPARAAAPVPGPGARRRAVRGRRHPQLRDRHGDVRPAPDGSERPAALDLVRLAIPRRTYTQSHVDYVIEVCADVAARAHDLRGYRIVDEPPALRHFTARFEPRTHVRVAST
jgi:tryptophanase